MIPEINVDVSSAPQIVVGGRGLIKLLGKVYRGHYNSAQDVTGAPRPRAARPRRNCRRYFKTQPCPDQSPRGSGMGQGVVEMRRWVR
jgi:hypothetical protein